MTTTPTGYFSSTDGCSTLRQFLGINYLLGHLLLAATWSYTRRHELRLIEHPFTGVGLVGWSIVYTVLWPMVFGISEVALGKVVPVAFLGLLLGAMVSRNRVIMAVDVDFAVVCEILGWSLAVLLALALNASIE